MRKKTEEGKRVKQVIPQSMRGGETGAAGGRGGGGKNEQIAKRVLENAPLPPHTKGIYV